MERTNAFRIGKRKKKQDNGKKEDKISRKRIEYKHIARSIFIHIHKKSSLSEYIHTFREIATTFKHHRIIIIIFGSSFQKKKRREKKSNSLRNKTRLTLHMSASMYRNPSLVHPFFSFRNIFLTSFRLHHVGILPYTGVPSSKVMLTAWCVMGSTCSIRTTPRP